MRVGLVCPYDWEVPGGVRSHVADLARLLLDRGHEVSVLAPGLPSAQVPPYVHLVGRTVPVPYNGSVARLAFGPRVALRTRAWLSEGRFDVLHVHEPAAPSLSMLAVWASDGPVVATFHSSNDRSRTLSSAAALMRPAMEKISARIAVSEQARQTLVTHLGGEPVVIPNGIYAAAFASAPRRPEWSDRPTIAFLGRADEPRKGFAVALETLLRVRQSVPDCRLLAAGPVRDRVSLVPEALRSYVDILGFVDDDRRASLLRSATVFLAPHLGGESFGIVVVEAMAAGAAIVASDLPAFRTLLAGDDAGVLFAAGDAESAADAVTRLIGDPELRAAAGERAKDLAARFDWSRVITDVEAVYATVAR